VDLADGPRRACLSRVLRVLARLCFRSVVALSFRWARFRTVRVFRADSPRVPGGQSAWSPRMVRYSRCVSGGSVAFSDSPRLRPDGPRKGADSPRYPAGQSTQPLRTVRPAWPDSPPEHGCFAPWFDSFLPSLVLPRVLQGIVPKT
jgi:hypothetical protein